MVVRLGFAVATAVNPDLLITDEVMAVGDEAFQKKCIRWVEGYLKQGGTLLLVSHSMYHVQKLCSHAIWLEHGRMRESGDALSVSQRYLAYSQSKSTQEMLDDHAHSQANGLYRVQNARLNGEELPATLAMGASLTVTAEIISPDGRTPHVMIGLVREDGTPIYGTGSEFDGVQLTQVHAHRSRSISLTMRHHSCPELSGAPTRDGPRRHGDYSIRWNEALSWSVKPVKWAWFVFPIAGSSGCRQLTTDRSVGQRKVISALK